MTDWKRSSVLVFLVGIGTLQMAGDLLGSVSLRAVGTAVTASPAPKVFTAHKGFETYSSVFAVMWRDKAGADHEMLLTPEIYGRVRGPYNRRNAYGAALSYAPVLNSNPLTQPMFKAVIQHTFCGSSTVLEEIGIDRSAAASPFVFELRPRQKLPSDHGWTLRYEVACDA